MRGNGGLRRRLQHSGGTPQPGSEQYQRLLAANIPIVVYFGDYIDNGPEDIQSTSFWGDGAGRRTGLCGAV